MTTPSSQTPPPEQEQPYPGRTGQMDPRPRCDNPRRPGRGGELRARCSFFASGRLSSYYSGEVLAPIGGETLPG